MSSYRYQNRGDDRGDRYHSESSTSRPGHSASSNSKSSYSRDRHDHGNERRSDRYADSSGRRFPPDWYGRAPTADESVEGHHHPKYDQVNRQNDEPSQHPHFGSTHQSVVVKKPKIDQDLSINSDRNYQGRTTTSSLPIKDEGDERPEDEDISYLFSDDQDDNSPGKGVAVKKSEEELRIEQARLRRQAILDKHSTVTKNLVPKSPSIPLNRSPPRSGIEEASYKTVADVDVSKQDIRKSPLKSQRASLGTKMEEQNIDDNIIYEEDDMFAPIQMVTTPGRPEITQMISSATNPTAGTSNTTLADNWDDHEGYYKVNPGELLNNGQYSVQTVLGKGVFSCVVSAQDLYHPSAQIPGAPPHLVAIKIVRNNDVMLRAAGKEIAYLEKMMMMDPKDEKHVVRLFAHFMHRNHCCMVFELLSLNLRQVLKKFGKDVGLSIRIVKHYAKQLFIALSLLEECQIIHADIKPDNILVDEANSLLKVSDFGSAGDVSDNEITPYLVSRFYRAPEIVLGLSYDRRIDVWAVGCTLYELFTGQILFPGKSNNHLLKCMMETMGKFNHKMIKRGKFSNAHFNVDTFHFISQETDKITGKDFVKSIPVVASTGDIRSKIIKHVDFESRKMALQFSDLLERCLCLNPERRISIMDALNHPFCA